MVHDKLKVPKEWINIGDMNPERHGGIFVKWNRDGYEVIRTRHFAELPDGFSENEHMFDHYWIYPDEFFVNPEKPQEGFTDWASREIETFHKPPVTQEVLTGETKPDRVSMNEHIEGLLSEYNEKIITDLCYAYSGYYGSHEMNLDADYWDYLQHHGIEEEKFR